jgi:nanoRNase/pAp phosphatase (c-di-AMP/oligoRNAs hydrolase)
LISIITKAIKYGELTSSAHPESRIAGSKDEALHGSIPQGGTHHERSNVPPYLIAELIIGCPKHTMRNTISNKVEYLRSCLLPARSVLIACHDYPDPDCIASAFGVYTLLRFWHVAKPVIAFGGFVGREENRTMVRSLGIPMLSYSQVKLDAFQKIIIVDSFPGNSNLSLPLSAPVSVIFDHHYNKNKQLVSCFQDIRQQVAATSTIVTQYLTAAGCPISPQLATALYYGIKTDSRDMAGDVSMDDVTMYRMLLAMVDYPLLLTIENPLRSQAFFKTVDKALESAIILGMIGYTHLGEIQSPDYVPEMADFLSRLNTIEYLVCSGLYIDQLFFSIRSKKGLKAGYYADRIASTMGGHGGGHLKIAAGRIPLKGMTPAEAEQQFLKVLKRIFHTGSKTAQPEKLLG